jgi:hypothetical protein
MSNYHPEAIYPQRISITARRRSLRIAHLVANGARVAGHANGTTGRPRWRRALLPLTFSPELRGSTLASGANWNAALTNAEAVRYTAPTALLGDPLRGARCRNRAHSLWRQSAVGWAHRRGRRGCLRRSAIVAANAVMAASVVCRRSACCKTRRTEVRLETVFGVAAERFMSLSVAPMTMADGLSGQCSVRRRACPTFPS